MTHRMQAAIGVAAVLTGVAGLILLQTGALGIMPVDDTPVARGEWIFRAARHPDDGRPIRYTGGMMMRMSCASCHGADGRGRSTPMSLTPDITYANLTAPAGMLEPSGARGHSYTDASIKRAITQGLDAEGATLAWPMPRWDLTDQELDDLIAYLKTLP